MSEEKRPKKKVSLPIYLLTIGSAILITAILSFFAFSAIHGDKQETLGTRTEETSEDKLALSEISELYTILMTQHYEDLDSNQLIEGALKGMAEATEDPHTVYLDEVDSSALNDDIQGSFEGIGAEIMKDQDVVRVISPIPGSPSEEAGVQPDDAITHVDDESVANLSINEAVDLIRGPKGTSVNLTILRGGQEVTISVERDSIPVETVLLEMDESHPEIAHLKITNFSVSTYEELVEGIQEAKDQGAERFIFDVRGNPGGLLDVALKIANIFVENGQPLMGLQEDEDEEPTYMNASDEYGEFKLDAPAVLLINEGSASASEILSGAMQEAGYPILGAPSYGKGTVQSIFPLHDSGEIKFTESIWLTAGGKWINEEGIQPDIEVESSPFMDLLTINPENTYVNGQVSEEVKNINKTLEALGYDTDPESNLYSDQTQEAVSDIQSRNKLEVDGEISEETVSAMSEEVRQKATEEDLQYNRAVEHLLN